MSIWPQMLSLINIFTKKAKPYVVIESEIDTIQIIEMPSF